MFPARRPPWDWELGLGHTDLKNKGILAVVARSTLPFAIIESPMPLRTTHDHLLTSFAGRSTPVATSPNVGCHWISRSLAPENTCVYYKLVTIFIKVSRLDRVTW